MTEVSLSTAGSSSDLAPGGKGDSEPSGLSFFGFGLTNGGGALEAGRLSRIPEKDFDRTSSTCLLFEYGPGDSSKLSSECSGDLVFVLIESSLLLKTSASEFLSDSFGSLDCATLVSFVCCLEIRLLRS